MTDFDIAARYYGEALLRNMELENQLATLRVRCAELEASIEAYRAEAAAGLLGAQLAQEKLQTARIDASGAARERDAMEDIAERTHGELLKALVENAKLRKAIEEHNQVQKVQEVKQ